MAEHNRDTELSSRKAIRDRLQSIYDDVWQGFQAQARRSDAIMDNWDAYNAILGARQFYNGNSEIFVPIICDAVNARKTRFTNQIFPTSGRYVEVISEDGEEPNAIMALLEHYMRQARMRTLVMPAMMVNGDVEGQYNVYVTWEERPRMSSGASCTGRWSRAPRSMTSSTRTSRKRKSSMPGRASRCCTTPTR